MDPYDDLAPDQLTEDAKSQQFSVDQNLARLRPDVRTPLESLAAFLRGTIWTASILAVVLGVLFFFLGTFGISADALGTELHWWSISPFVIWLVATAVSLTTSNGALRTAARVGPTSMVAAACLLTYLTVIGWFSEIYFRLSWLKPADGTLSSSWPYELTREVSVQSSTSTLTGGPTVWQNAPDGLYGFATTAERLIGVALLVASVAIAVQHFRRPTGK